MRHLDTRSICDECGRPASIERGIVFLCERCDATINSLSLSGGNETAAAQSSVPPLGAAAVSANSAIETTSLASTAPGPSPVTGMFGDDANAGGDHEAVTAPSIVSESFEKTEVAVTGASPGACGTERELVGAANSVPDRGNIGKEAHPAVGTSVVSCDEADGDVGRQPPMASRLAPPVSHGPFSDDLGIPSFLRRGSPDCIIKNATTFAVTHDSLTHASTASSSTASISTT